MMKKQLSNRLWRGVLAALLLGSISTAGFAQDRSATPDPKPQVTNKVREASLRKKVAPASSLKSETTINETEPNDLYNSSGIITINPTSTSRITLTGTTEGVQGDHKDFWNIQVANTGNFYIAPDGADSEVSFQVLEKTSFGTADIVNTTNWNPGDEPFTLTLYSTSVYQLVIIDNFSGAAQVSNSVFIAGQGYFEPSNTNSTVSVDVNEVLAGQDITATVTLFDQNNDRIVFGGRQVAIWYLIGMSLYPAGTAADNNDGSYTLTFSIPEPGTYQIRAYYDEGTQLINQSPSVLVTEPPPTGWVVDVNATIDSFFADAEFGMSSAAGDGLDQELDTPEPPASIGNQLRAYFSHPEYEGIVSDNYVADIRALHDFSGGPSHWVLTVESNVPGTANLHFTRPEGFTAPINVLSTGGWMYFDGEDASFDVAVAVDGESSEAVHIWVGDNTGPDLYVDGQLYGPAIWDAATAKELSTNASDIAGVSFIVVLASLNGGETWDVLFDTSELEFKRNAATASRDNGYTYYFEAPESFGEIENVLFRSYTMDHAGNFTQWVADETITVGRGTQTLPLTAGWNMMGASLGNASGSDLNNAFRFNWTGTGYVRVDDYNTFLGHWAGTYNAGSDVVSGTVVTGSEGDAADVWVSAGWTMITNPLLRHVSIDEMMVMPEGEEAEPVSFETAVENEWVLPAVYGYNPETGYYLADHFMPNTAYWVGSYGDLALRFVIHGMQMQPAKQAAPAPRMVLSLVDGKARMSFGLTLEAGRDIPAPPSAPGTSEAGFAGAKTILGSLYAEKSIAAGARSENTLQVGGAHREVTLNWTGMTLPGLRSYIVAPDGRQHDLSADGSLTWNTSAGMPVVVTEPISTSNDDRTNLPSALTLHQNYPNPFNPATTLSFAMPAAGQVKLTVMNMLGQNVATVVNGMMPAGSHAVSFDASKLSSGVYLYRLEAAGQTITKRMTLVK